MYRYRDWLITQVIKRGKVFFLGYSVLKSLENCQTKIQISHCDYGPSIGNLGHLTLAIKPHSFRQVPCPPWASASYRRNQRS